MSYVRDTTDALRWLTFEAYRDEMKELRLTMRNVELKAQANITLAGIFLAAALAYLEKLNTNPSPMEKFIIVAAIVLLGLSVMLALFVLGIRDLTEPPSGNFLDQYLGVMLRRGTEQRVREAIETAYRRGVEEWTSAIRKAHDVNQEKARLLSESQGILLAAIALFALLTIARVITMSGPGVK